MSLGIFPAATFGFHSCKKSPDLFFKLELNVYFVFCLPATSFNFLAMCIKSGDDWANIGDDDCLDGSPRNTDFLSMLNDMVSSSSVQTAKETLLRRLCSKA